MSVHIDRFDRNQYIAYTYRENQRIIVGVAVRNSPRRWTVIVAPRTRRTFRRRGAERLLYKLAVEKLTRQAIDRAELSTYRPGFDDRLGEQRGWRR